MRKDLVGTVVGDKVSKTRVIQVERLVQHPLYKKVLKVRKKFYAHDEANQSKSGDKVRIEETRPLSRLKRWRVVEVMNRVNEVPVK